MTDFYNELLKKSIDRQASELISGGATEQDRYGHLLDPVKGRNLEQEEDDRRQETLARVQRGREEKRIQRESESLEHSKNLQRTIMDVSNREWREANEFLDRNKKYLDKAKETIKREQNKTYFS